MQNIYDLILKNYKINEKTDYLLKHILENNEINIERILFIINYMISYKLDISSIIAYLLIESKTEIDVSFDQDIIGIFNNLKLWEVSKEYENKLDEAETLRKMFIAMSKDIRVIIIKLIRILYEAKCCSLPLSKYQKSFLNNVREIFAPLAERLGLNSLKSELEDLCLKFLNPDIYQELDNSILLKKDENQKQIELTKQKLTDIISELGLKDANIMARQKHYSSVYKKLKSNNITLAQIYDLIAMRVIVNTVEECYAVLGKIHGIYKPMDGRFKDYIANPKANGYQSLHTTIIAENNRPLEIQIRTVEMHKTSEYGVVAHWIYKEKRTKMSDLDIKLSWLRNIMDSSDSMNPEEFVETLKTNLFSGQIFVQTPKGKVLEFPEGSTIIDFAYAIHSDIGNSCVGGKINNKIKPITTKLNNGDIVEIITSSSSKGPSRDWLSSVKTAGARSKISAFFKKELKDDNIKNGKIILEQAIKTAGYIPSKLIDEKYLDNIFYKFAFSSIDEIYAAIGYGSLSSKQIVNRLISEYEKDNRPEFINVIPKTAAIHIKSNNDGVLIDGDSGLLVRYAGCCTPVYGEEIIGYISRGRGVTIHRANCTNLSYLESERLIRAEWSDKNTNKSMIANLKIISNKMNNLLFKLAEVINNAKLNIVSLDTKDSGYKLFTNAKIEVKNQEELNLLITKLQEINGIEEVFRV